MSKEVWGQAIINGVVVPLHYIQHRTETDESARELAIQRAMQERAAKAQSTLSGQESAHAWPNEHVDTGDSETVWQKIRSALALKKNAALAEKMTETLDYAEADMASGRFNASGAGPSGRSHAEGPLWQTGLVRSKKGSPHHGADGQPGVNAAGDVREFKGDTSLDANLFSNNSENLGNGWNGWGSPTTILNDEKTARSFPRTQGRKGAVTASREYEDYQAMKEVRPSRADEIPARYKAAAAIEHAAPVSQVDLNYEYEKSNAAREGRAPRSRAQVQSSMDATEKTEKSRKASGLSDYDFTDFG